jgi:hypothetical protein
MTESTSIQSLVTSFSKPEIGMPAARNDQPPSYGPRVPEFQKTIEINRPFAASSGLPALATCFFGELVVEGSDTFIRGGLVHSGDKHFNVPNYELILGTPIDKLVQLKLDVEVWRDDDNEILMPGVKTSSETDASTFWDLKTWTTGTDYDDDTPPDVADGIGSIVIPIGHLVIADGAATFSLVGCGHVTIGHCGGTLSHSRG